MEEETNGLEIKMVTEQDPDRIKARIVSALEIEVLGMNAYISPGVTTIDGIKTSLPYRNDILYIKKTSDSFIFIHIFGINILFAGSDRVYINIATFYDSKVRFVLLYSIPNDKIRDPA